MMMVFTTIYGVTDQFMFPSWLAFLAEAFEAFNRILIVGVVVYAFPAASCLVMSSKVLDIFCIS